MSKGENIFKRKDGRWEARYVKSRNAEGKIKYGYCYGKSYREAKDKAAKLKAAIIMGALPPETGKPRKFVFYCDEWLRVRRSRVKESTYIKYNTILEKHIKPCFGELAPEGITSARVAEFTDGLQHKAGLSPKTVRDILILLRGILKYTSAQIPDALPQIEISYPRCVRQEMRVLSREEQGRLAAYLVDNMDACSFGVTLALFTGMRIGELCALRWENISLEERTVLVNATLQRLQDRDAQCGARTRIVTGAPKSESSTRIIPLTDYTAELCRRMKPQSAAAFVLTGTEKYMEPRTLQYRIEKYCRSCDLEGVHFHTLRHTFATRAVEAGFELKSLSEILGHSSTTVTLDRYVHSSLDMKRRNMEKLAASGFCAAPSNPGVTGDEA